MENKNIKLMLGNNIDSLKQLPDNFVDSIVTDPPYGLSFMNKKWDYDVPSVEFWKEVYRVLKPGGHILSFGGTRTYHRMVVNIEDAGFEIRDQIMWVYGSGFPKSLNIGKEVDKKLGNEREVVGEKTGGAYSCKHDLGINRVSLLGNGDGRKTPPKRGEDFSKITKGNTPYEGWGTGLKPANEPICMARKPIEEKTITDNVLKYGTGGINIDGCKIGNEIIEGKKRGNSVNTNFMSGGYTETTQGRFPANFIIDEDASKLLDEQSGEGKSTKYKTTLPKIAGNNIFNGGNNGNGRTEIMTDRGYEDTGGASRFFYVPKVSKKERNMGLDNFEDKVLKSNQINVDKINGREVSNPKESIVKNTHPTLKPINLMTYLCRLITPKGGVILDPYMGSGSTGISALLEGFEFIGMEMDEDYFKIAETRINNYELYKDLIKKK